MSSLPNEIFSNITNFLPNDDITDLMLLSRNFNALVTPRLQRINQEMATTNQSIKSFMPSPAPELDNTEWISRLNLERFEPVGTEAKQQMKDMFEAHHIIMELLSNVAQAPQCGTAMWHKHRRMFRRFKKVMYLGRFDDETFLRILCALVAMPKFREKYHVYASFAQVVFMIAIRSFKNYSEDNSEAYEDLSRIWTFYNPPV